MNPASPTPPSRFALPLLLAGGAVAVAPFTSAAAGLLLGAFLGLTLGNPRTRETQVWTRRLLPLAVIGLGAQMNLIAVAKAGLHGLLITALSITLVLSLGLWLARRFKVDRDAGLLIAVGTAICGGSAIAAVAPVVRARANQVSVALATVFLLNAVALLVFPPVGHALGLSQDSFGLWAALAIHDTSSVVGAGLAYGPRALEVATTVKLARALWIVPVTLFIGYLDARRRRNEGDPADTADTPPVKKPWFIAGFLVMAGLVTWIPALHVPGHWVAFAAQRLLVLTLFLIGAALSRKALKDVGVRPLLQGLVLWVVICLAGLVLVRFGLLA
ncbi:MAG: putative sulfate exporter family transporter [Nevskia sp.]|nr:putative sulfate exporter family transporter [Nevskia sp.]MDR3670555.1 putative sulfate exporter family transporter [Holophaga sp.]